MRRTKIIATIGPASNGEEQIAALTAAGVDVFRINFSHSDPESHRTTYQRIRASAQQTGRPVAVMQDLSGPKVRIGALEGGTPVTLEPGASLRIATGDFIGSQERVSTPFAALARSVRPRDRLLLDDGRIELQVVDSDGQEIRTSVVHGGELSEHKGINAPGVSFTESGLTDKDVRDLEFGLSLGVDLVAVSFVQTARDLEQARSIVDAAGSAVGLVAKIERPQAVDEIDSILEVADAIMVARGDLGLEVPLEQVPRFQKHLTRRARSAGVPVIVATQVLESMRFDPRPTRAEVSDAANAVDDSVDAIMLSGETAVGRAPIDAVKTLDAIITDAESLGPSLFLLDENPDRSHGQALCNAAVTLAHTADAAAIVAVTHAGSTAHQLAALRPRIPIVGVTDDEGTARRLMLCWGVTPITIDAEALALPTVPLSLVGRGVLPDGATIALVRVHADLGQPDANFVSLIRLGGDTSHPHETSSP